MTRLLRQRPTSDLTVTDLFCGAGGSSLGASQAGVRVMQALNHWPRAIEIHSANFPDARHECADVSQVDPRRYHPTDILIGSPECTNHSLASGKRRKGLGQRDFFTAPPNAADERSRATMWDMVRFAEAHRYELILTENVCDVVGWELFDAWLGAMSALGYDFRIVSLNSMFAWPTPQSRDRAYIVLWRRGNPAPDLDIRPLASCPAHGVVEAVQMWKPAALRRSPRNPVGKYRQQYVYGCPSCRTAIEPYYYAALNAIDWSLPGTRIGDRSRPLEPRTVARIQKGLDRYGCERLTVRTQLDGSLGVSALVDPAHIVEMREHSPGRSLAGPLSTCIATAAQMGIVSELPRLSMVVTAGSNQTATRTVAEALGTQTGTERFALVQLPAQGDSPFLAALRQNVDALPITHPVGTVCGSPHFGIVRPEPAPSAAASVDDCYFRMLAPHEVGAAMAFTPDFRVWGSRKDQYLLYGNAVTPPAMKLLIDRCIATLDTGRRRRVA